MGLLNATTGSPLITVWLLNAFTAGAHSDTKTKCNPSFYFSFFLFLELYRELQQVRERIEQEHRRLSQLQALLRDDGNKVETYSPAATSCASVLHYKLIPAKL